MFEVILLLALSITILVRGGHSGLSSAPFTWPGGSKDVLLAFSLAVLAFAAFVAPLISWVFLSSVTSSYVAANTQTSRVIFAGARGGLWTHALAGVSRGSTRPRSPRSPSWRRASRSGSSPPPSPIPRPPPASSARSASSG